MKPNYDNKKLYSYPVVCVRATHLLGCEQHAAALSNGFRWVSSDNEHDIFYNKMFETYRYIHKESKRFYERRALHIKANS